MSVRRRRGTKSEHWFYRFTYKHTDYCEGGFRTAAQAKEAERLKYDDLIERRLHPEMFKSGAL